MVPALSRFFCPFNATQTIRATAPGLSMPGSCCVLLLTMQFDALLPNRSPRCLSTGRVHGVQCPSELDLTEIILTSRSGFPLLRLAYRSCACLIDRSQRRPVSPDANLSAPLSRLASVGTPEFVDHFESAYSGSESSTGHVRIPHDANCIAASLQGFKPSVGWDSGVGFPLVSVSWLSWVSPSLGLSLSWFLAFASLLSGT